MSYLSNFERSFSDHTLHLVRTYDGSYKATLMINCLLGLLIVPKETALIAIPEEPLSNLPHWGIRCKSIKCHGKPTKTNPNPGSLRGLVANLRHSVAHFRIKPIPSEGEVHSFEYTNRTGFHAIISLDEMRTFIEKLTEHLIKN